MVEITLAYTHRDIVSTVSFKSGRIKTFTLVVEIILQGGNMYVEELQRRLTRSKKKLFFRKVSKAGVYETVRKFRITSEFFKL